MDIRLSRYDDSTINIHVDSCFIMNLLYKILMLVIAFSMILSLIFISMITIDLNEIWSAINTTMDIIKEQQDEIKNLQILYLRKEGISI